MSPTNSPESEPSAQSSGRQLSKDDLEKFRKFSDTIGAALAGNLNRNVQAEAKTKEPQGDWPMWTLGYRAFRLSPDGKDARELGADGCWHCVDANYVLTHATRAA